jgi:starch-binding outer membrane protein, SusD/RagB family
MTYSARLRRCAIAAAAALSFGCKSDSLLNSDNPDVIDPGALGTAQGAVAQYNGVIGDFALAADGSGTGGPGLVEAGAWFTDEARFGGTPPEVKQMDLRAVREEAAAWQNMYLNLHRAREGAEQAAKSLATFNASDPRIGEMYAISALVHILLGENYCSGVPFSTTQPELTYGDPQTSKQIYNRAIARLDLAKQNAFGNATVTSLEAVLRGRALLDLANNSGDVAGFTAAANAVVNVPTTFTYQAYHSTSTSRENNFMYTDIFSADRLSVSDREGTNGLNFGSASDPRVPLEIPTANGGLSRFDNVTPMIRFLRYNTLSAPVVHASGIEARLIEAEAALSAGDVATWLAKLNVARATVSGLAPLTDPGTPAARVDLMFRERAMWMFMTGHRLGDLRRMVRQYGRGAETVFPTGAYHKDNLVRGTDVNIVIPISERNNPKFSGCLDRNA